MNPLKPKRLKCEEISSASLLLKTTRTELKNRHGTFIQTLTSASGFLHPVEATAFFSDCG